MIMFRKDEVKEESQLNILRIILIVQSIRSQNNHTGNVALDTNITKPG